MAVLMDGKALAERVRAEVAEDVRRFDRPVGLATVLVGEDPASEIYVSSKQKACLWGAKTMFTPADRGIREGDPSFGTPHGQHACLRLR